jgi:hypothetical protein
MLRKTKDLQGAPLTARDGQIGHVKDFYLDDQTWTVRYLVADTGQWLPGRQVLISPFAVTKLMTGSRPSIGVNLSKSQIEGSPSVEEHAPISRQYEAQYLDYFGWPSYWPGPLLWGPVEAPWSYLPGNLQMQPRLQHEDQGADSHLRSAREISGFAGYQIQALDQLFGHVEYLVLEDTNWAVRYLVCDTRTWRPGKHFLLAPQWIAWISWTESRVYVDLDREAIQRAPAFDASGQVSREYEQQLYDHYNRVPYWRPQGERKGAPDGVATGRA